MCIYIYRGKHSQIVLGTMPAMAKRKPKGQGIAAVQRCERNRKANLVVTWALPHMDFDAVETSGQLWPRGSLKRKKVQKCMYPWVHKTKGRWFTLKTAKLICRKLWDKLPCTPNRDPAQPFSCYMTDQAKRLLTLARASKKHLRNMGDPSNMDTLLDVDA